MQTILLGIFAWLFAQGFSQNDDDALAAPPQIKTAPTIRAQCRCPDAMEPNVVILEGLAVDAELTLGADGVSANDRRATIFTIWGGKESDYAGRTRIWHSTDASQCGVAFDYGRKYKIAARKTEAGELETDRCLMRAVRQNE